MAYRKLKVQIGELLAGADFTAALDTIGALPGRQAVNPLFAFLYAGEETLRWRAVSAMGRVVAGMADHDLESARVVMRRFMWNLNDESGGIGWGSPEAMGEITAVHAGLAGEYGRILLSYIDPDGNFLEHERLQRGALWGVGRLAHARPDIAMSAADHLRRF
ncbi:DVU0298 family protein, partial [Desulfosarcina cetonica]|uniref:DVU0298 family protein n=1 Tax=Desulfosarcina cetonica TaxID=90730 RepID=UPI000B046028